MKKKTKSQIGKSSRNRGKIFECKVRNELIEQGWIVCKFDNNVEFGREFHLDSQIEEAKKILATGINQVYVPKYKIGRLVQAKPKFNPFTKSIMMNSAGFPDFICFRARENVGTIDGLMSFKVKLVECKINGIFDKEEKEKVKWIIENLKIPVEIAYQVKEGRKNKIKYKEVK